MMKKGFTLIEVIVVLAILGIILLLILGIFNFGLHNYILGTDQQDEQFNVRLAADILANEIKTVTHLGIYPTSGENVNLDSNGDGSIDSNDKINSATGVLYYTSGERLIREENGATKYITDAVISNIVFNIVVDDIGTTDHTDDIYYLEYKLTGSSGYEIETKIELLNIQGVCPTLPLFNDFYLTTLPTATGDVLSTFYLYDFDWTDYKDE